MPNNANMFATIAVYLLMSSSLCHGYRPFPSAGVRGVSVVRAVKEELAFKRRDDDIWTSRRKIIRSTLKPMVKRQIEKKNTAFEKATKNPEEKIVEDDGKKKKPTGLLVSAFFIAVSATVLRLGGRTAFVNMLGLDFVTGSGIRTQVNDFVNFFHSLGDVSQYGAFFLAWLAAKVLCVDAFTIVLALSSGVLFGGIFQGTAVSVVCSSTASLCVFFLSRYFLREKSEKEIARRPAYRAVDRACAKEGFKTVFTLRLSPLLPIPIGAYNYLYGATSVSPLDFFAGISLGSVKPYLLDSYLGLFGKSLIDEKDGLGGAGGEYGDWALLGFISVVILVGAFATEVAASTWEEIQRENDIDLLEKGKEEVEGGEGGLGSMEGSLAGSQFFRMMGISKDDLGKLPKWILGIAKDVFAATSRVDTVIDDEISAVAFELKAGIDLGWDLGVTKTEALRDLQGEQQSETLKASSPPFQPIGEELVYSYPGKRKINLFEEVLPDMTNISEYTYESLVFSFLLIGAAGNLMGDEPESKIESVPIVN